MKLTPREEGDRWLRQAKQDLDDAQYARDGSRFHLTCFLAQQSAEKALKAFLYSRGQALVWGHSVARLCQDATALDAEFADLRTKAAPLDKYYIPTRYPNGLPDGIPAEAFDAVDAERALELAGLVITFVEARLVAADNDTG
jgi:HEPN domain-containing protein